MADNKKAVLLYCDLIHTIEKLDDKRAGQFFKHYLRYVNDQDPTAPNQIVEVLFEQTKQNLKRDLKRYEAKCLKNKENAQKRWDKKDAVASDGTIRIANDADIDTDTDTDTDKDTDIYRHFKHLSMSVSDFKKLEKEYNKKQIDYILDNIENFKANKKYVSLYLTARNWLKREYPNNEADKKGTIGDGGVFLSNEKRKNPWEGMKPEAVKKIKAEIHKHG